jgi:TldD protein
MTQNQSLFFQKFGITPNDLQNYLGEALSAGGEYADLYFEYLTSTAISVD